jgi:small subunit ribosomal protein S4e
MVKRHLKRMDSPKSWPITRKETVFVIRPRPGGHKMGQSLPLSILLRDVLGYASTTRAVRFLLTTQEVLVNGRRVRKPEDTAGLMDVVTFPSTKTSFRILIDQRNKLFTLPIAGEEAKLIPSKVTSKRLQPGGKLQLGFHNGRTLITDEKGYKAGDTLLLTMENKSHAHFPLAKGTFALITGGKHVGATGIVEKTEGSKVLLAAEGAIIETTKEHTFSLGHEKPAIKLKS